MNLKIDVYLHSSDESKILTKLNEIHRSIIHLGDNMAGELDALKTQVQANSDVIDSAVLLIQGIKAALDAAIASNDPAALTALSASLGAKDAELAAAVAANTPAVP
jgi:hypothetical protein